MFSMTLILHMHAQVPKVEFFVSQSLKLQGLGITQFILPAPT